MSDVPRVPLLIGGELVQSKTTDWRDVINPATQEVVAKVPFATKEELALAVSNAKEDFQTWRTTSQAARTRVMLNLQSRVRETTGNIADKIGTASGQAHVCNYD